jgi:hypothetical protein
MADTATNQPTSNLRATDAHTHLRSHGSNIIASIRGSMWAVAPFWLSSSTYRDFIHKGLFILLTGAKQLRLVNNYDLDRPFV